MAFSADEIRANRDYFAHKLRAEKQRNDFLHAVEGGCSTSYSSTRAVDRPSSTDTFQVHCVPQWKNWSNSPRFGPKKEIVTYCWGHN
jgi:hypothetical protein